MPKKLTRGIELMPAPPPDVDPVDQHEPDDLAEGERHDGEVIAAEAQDREAEQDAPQGCENPGERQADPERQAEGGREKGVGIGADRVEGDIAQVQEARETHYDVEAPAQHHVGEDQDTEVDPVAGLVEAPLDQVDDEREGEGDAEEDRQAIGRHLLEAAGGCVDGLRRLGRARHRLAGGAARRAGVLEDPECEDQGADQRNQAPALAQE